MKNQTKTAAGNHFYLVANMKISFINDIPDLTTYVRIKFDFKFLEFYLQYCGIKGNILLGHL